MLYLAPPFYIINRVSVFRDHEDPLQWYYLPGPPKLTEVSDAQTGAKVPQVQVIRFRGGAGSGGFLNFDVNLGIDPAVLDEIKDEIKRSERLKELPRLAPVPLIDGSVKLMLFDKQTGEGPGADGPAVEFVRSLSHNAKPALYGDNQSAFSVQLTKEGVTVLEQALQGEMSPIGIIYSLDYLALRPAYSVRLNIDWERVQKHLDETFGSDSIFYQSQITDAVDKLIDNRAIVLEDDLFVTEGEDEDLAARHEQAVDEVRAMITDAFFQPSLNPVEPEKEDTWDKIEHWAKTSAALAVTGGWGTLVGFTYRQVDYTRIDRKKLNVNFSERAAVKKSIFPQSHLSGLFKALREPGIDLSRFVLSVDLGDPWYERRKIQVLSRADYQEDDIASIQVTLEYGDQVKSVMLEPTSSAFNVEWSSIVQAGAMKRPVSYRYKVLFRHADGTERPISLQSSDLTEQGDILEIVPRELYSIVPVPIQALNFPWERYSHVEVRTQYDDPDHGISQSDSFVLSKETVTEASWKMFVLDAGKTRFRHKIIYRAVDFRDVEMPWTDTGEERLTIRDPFPSKRTLEIVPVFDWSKVDRAFVDVSYEDSNHGVLEEKSFEFSDKAAATERFTVALQDVNRRQIGFQATIIRKDGSLSEIPPSFTLERRITVRDDMNGHKVVALRPEDGDFAELKIRDIVVSIRYDDPERGLSFADQFVFNSAADRAAFEYDYAAEGPHGYQLRVVQRFTNGLSHAADWITSDDPEVVIPLK